jgi:Pyruvate/2-oxoacid:ferredoxin oxidoreductase delta subunit
VRLIDVPAPEYAFGYRAPPRSGNEINGLGDPKRQQARHVFHSSGDSRLEWQALDDFFGLINSWRVLWHVIVNAWQLRNSDGQVAAAKRPVNDRRGVTEKIKESARGFGAELIGISQVTDDAVYEGRSISFPYAICLGLSMDRTEMQHAPHIRAAVEVMQTYKEISRIAIRLARDIRKMGWPARAYGNPNSTDILHIPLAINAGLGQLGKHGSIINETLGSNFRLAVVLTDLPLICDEKVDIGVDDLCLQCQRCVIDCPPNAIFQHKQLVRGVEKWYVDFDKCIPYFTKTHGCAICIEVCPWSIPGRGPTLSRKMLSKRAMQT